ncbi:MAG: transposase [Patescibacteria group bacterium]
MLYTNRPPHIYIDNYIYFLTARTIKGVKYFNGDYGKQLLLNVINTAIKMFNCKLSAWVILSNHYHLLMKVKSGKNLPCLVGNIHANSSRLLNQEDKSLGRKIWWNYWDKCVETEKSYFTHLNYIHHNPVKHGYAKRMEDYEFSSYKYYQQKQGKVWLDSCFEIYPIIDFTK